ncbi:innate immunity activator protein isoform X2 [Amia ocellicauda]|uniref:innate immunity activator protein isoform X2 n=1 Tax=Amia ocellicauda TaxID=2972642 RepID=UPI003463F453
METKDETSDTDSGIILQSGPDSPSSPVKDLTTHTRAVKLRHKSLEDRLELCLLELKKLCIREAELTGHLSKDYPLLPGEKPPHIRRRIGAAFKLDEQSILQGGEDPELRSLEADLALQLQIYEAARRLSLEEHLSKPVKRSRLQQVKREERKVKELQGAVFQLRLRHGRASPCRAGTPPQQRDPAISDDSSLSDSALLEEEETPSQPAPPAADPPPTHLAVPLQARQGSPLPSRHSPRPTPPKTLEGLHPGYIPVEYERCPIQNSPWKESSLDQPYQKPKKTHSACSSQSSSPAVTPVSTPVDPRLGETALPFQFTPIKNLALHHNHSSSAPSTPELAGRRPHSQSFRVPNTNPPQDPNQNRGRARQPMRRLIDFTVTSPEYSPQRGTLGNPLYQSSSEDSNSEYSVPSYTSSPSHEMVSELAKPCPPPYPGYHGGHYPAHQNGHHGGYPAFSGPGYYRNIQHQSSPNFHRGYVDEGVGFSPELDMGRLYVGPPPPHHLHWDQRDGWYEEMPPRRISRPLPAHVKLSRAPSLKEYPHHHPSISRALPREVVSEELKSWHQRNQFRGGRPHSLDRQGAVRLRSAPGRESPLSLQHNFHPQRHILQRAPDGTPVQWFVEEDAEIVSQV